MRGRKSRTRSPFVEPLEGRFLLSTASVQGYYPGIVSSQGFFSGSGTSQSYYQRQARVRYQYQSYVGFLQKIELHSKATTAEYLALRDDALAISQAAASTSLSQDAADRKAAAASVQIDRGFLDGFLDNQGWAEIKSRMVANLDGLNVPESVVDQTIIDMRAAAQSVGLTAGAYNDLANKAEKLRQAEVYLPSGYGHFDDPQLFYTQHLRGFIRGGTVEKKKAKTTLNNDVHAIATPPGNAAALAVLNRDVKDFETIGSRITVAANQEVKSDYLATFASGSPDETALSQLNTSLHQVVGTTAQPKTTWNAISRIVADAPAFYVAAGSSTANIARILDDIGSYLAAGGSAPLNPFRVQVVKTGAKSGD